MAGGGADRVIGRRQEVEDPAESALLVVQCSDPTVLTPDRGTGH